MAFSADNLRSIADSLSGIMAFFEKFRSLPIPNVPAYTSDMTEKVEAHQQFIEECGQFFSELRNIDLPADAFDATAFSDAMAEIEAELSRTRPGHFIVDGAESISIGPNSIHIILPILKDSEEPGEINPFTLSRVDLAVTAGTAGNTGTKTTQCDYEYDVTDPENSGGPALLEDVNPTDSPHKHKRPTVGYMIPGTAGIMCRDGNGNIVLLWINERTEQEAC